MVTCMHRDIREVPVGSVQLGHHEDEWLIMIGVINGLPLPGFQRALQQFRQSQEREPRHCIHQSSGLPDMLLAKNCEGQVPRQRYKPSQDHDLAQPTLNITMALQPTMK